MVTIKKAMRVSPRLHDPTRRPNNNVEPTSIRSKDESEAAEDLESKDSTTKMVICETTELEEYLGTNRNRSMRRILPPEPSSQTKDDHVALKLLKHLDHVLSATQQTRKRKRKTQYQVQRFLDTWLKQHPEDPSVRYIQGGRYEIFLNKAADKGCACFMALAKTFGLMDIVRSQTVIDDDGASKDRVVDMILRYAIRQARRDDRLPQQDGLCRFGNFSFIVSFGNSLAQDPHVDVVSPHFQFGLMVTNERPGTRWYTMSSTVSTSEPVSVPWMIDLWTKPGHWEAKLRLPRPYQDATGLSLFDGRSRDVIGPPEALITSLHESQHAKQMVIQYGSVATPLHWLEERGYERVPTGSVLSLPGGEVHAGPASDKARAVIFFTGCLSSALKEERDPTTGGCGNNGKMVASQLLEYHPDTQYSGVAFYAQLAQILWNFPTMNIQAREYLLKLIQYHTQSFSNVPWSCHLVNQQLAEHVRVWEARRSPRSALPLAEALTTKIRKIARNDMLCSVDRFEGYQLVSVPGLQTEHDGQYYDADVYQHPGTCKAILVYANPNLDYSDLEGAFLSESLRLRIYNEGEKFDGKNGILQFQEGETVKCIVKRKPKICKNMT